MKKPFVLLFVFALILAFAAGPVMAESPPGSPAVTEASAIFPAASIAQAEPAITAADIGGVGFLLGVIAVLGIITLASQAYLVHLQRGKYVTATLETSIEAASAVKPRKRKSKPKPAAGFPPAAA